MLVQGDVAAGQPADERVEGDGKVVVAVRGGGERPIDGHGDAQFLQQLALQAVGRILTGFDLAAGELPFERQCHAFAALGSQDLPIVYDNGAGHVEMALH